MKTPSPSPSVTQQGIEVVNFLGGWGITITIIIAFLALLVSLPSIGKLSTKRESNRKRKIRGDIPVDPKLTRKENVARHRAKQEKKRRK